MENARYPGGSGGDASMQHVANTFQECRWGKLNNSDTIRCGSVFHPGIIICRVICAAASNVFDTEYSTSHFTSLLQEVVREKL